MNFTIWVDPYLVISEKSKEDSKRNNAVSLYALYGHVPDK